MVWVLGCGCGGVALVGMGSKVRVLAQLKLHFSKESEKEHLGWVPGWLNGQTEVKDTVSEKKTIQNSVLGH
jgi:hypothetical protein